MKTKTTKRKTRKKRHGKTQNKNKKLDMNIPGRKQPSQIKNHIFFYTRNKEGE